MTQGKLRELLQSPFTSMHNLLLAFREATIPFNISGATPSTFLKLSIISHWNYLQ